MPRLTREEREEAKAYSRSYACPHCGATAEVKYNNVLVTHDRNCPRYRPRVRNRATR